MPVLTAMVGAATGYFWAEMHANGLHDWGFVKYAAQYVAIGGTLGVLGGVSLSLFGHAALHHVTVEDDPKYKEKRKASSTQGSSASITKFYDKSDVQDHNKSTTKTAQKYDEKNKADKAERSQILEMGTEGIERKRKEALGIKTSIGNKSDATNKSGTSKSGINKSGINKGK